MDGTFDLLAYAKRRRLRTRNLHDGGPAGPETSRFAGVFFHMPSLGVLYARLASVSGRLTYVAETSRGLRLCFFSLPTAGVHDACEGVSP